MDPHSRKLLQLFIQRRSTNSANTNHYDESFVQQDRFVKDTSRFITAQCSRRAGKTNGLALKFINSMSKHPGAFHPYIALTRESARNIMWPVMQEMNDRFKIGCEFTESNLTVTHPNGARLQLFGADMKNFIRRLKGIKTPGAAIDEAQDFGSHIQALVDDVLTPTLTDYDDSWLAITGTPGPIPMGYFYEITAQRKYGFSFHEWTLFDNPYLPNAKSFVEELKKKMGWEEDNPTLLREWKNKWVLDVESLFIRYSEEKNGFDFKTVSSKDWKYILGIDVGFDDSDALAVLAWKDDDPNVYLADEVITGGQDITSLVEQVQRLSRIYDISKMVIDTGGLGKKIAEEIIRRHHIPVHAADKSRKMENAALLNDWLRLGRFKARPDSRFAQDSYRVQIDWDKTTPDSIKLKSDFHSDIIDAVLYAFRESPAFSYRTPTNKPKYGSAEWAHQEVTDMEKSAEEYFNRQHEELNI